MNVAAYPAELSEELSDGLALAGATVVGVSELVPENQTISDADMLIVELSDHPTRRLRELVRVVETVGLPVIVVLSQPDLALLEGTGTVTDFLVSPVDPVELRIRLRRVSAGESSETTLRFKDLEINPLLYRATLAEEPMDLTFMEYELLRFLVENPVRVWSRQQLLSKVWGYEYYGGARTVDVHIRRLRSKLGEGRSSWITTVRSVGYRFG